MDGECSMSGRFWRICWQYQLYKIKCNEKYVKTEELEFNIIQLPKFQSDKLKKFEGKEQWVAYLKGDNQELIDRAKQDNKYIKRLDELLENYWKHEKME